MSAGKLAFPSWVMGQVLLPEQFVAQQEAILAQVAARAELSGLPSHGLLRLQIDETLLASGALRVEALTYLFPSGLLVDVPGNMVTTNINLSDTSSETASIYLHVDNELTDASGLTRYEDDPRSVRRAVFHGELTTTAQLDDARESVKLMGLQRQESGWALADYAPPLLAAGAASSPFLRRLLGACHRAVRVVEAQLSRRIRDALLGHEQVAELRRVQAAARRAAVLLADHGCGEDQRQVVSLHPYLVFSGLREFLLEAGVLQTSGSQEPPRYRHDALAECFEATRWQIEGMLEASSLSSKRLVFERRGAWWVAGPMPESLAAVGEVYLVVKSTSGEPVDLTGVKLASPQRVDEVYTRALSGVPLRPMPTALAASFAQVYGSDAVFYEIAVDDPEWATAARDGELCFPAWRELESVSAALIWGGGGRG
ncbi:type VI secretion system baseplate subunit TssK [Pseudenhygromyxa sp. WMMC2535]|uniref:type VI secretion system baseplate subunit TssK n=1 Tax=Pseudenhygromyxa sp. WMMC2535 TaxID=2712867 RepID=UPI001557F538|nr:type VI secretion system baseplate subunit TssK [Pseudenhygromyxa sp. WMMC2535]NVB39234.1 type VI secretion system baseplate subunit TssK [Pseudenhygromyxa sp. WMMC2535]